MSERDVRLLRDAYARWGRGDFTDADIWHPEVQFVITGVEARTYTGPQGVKVGWYDFLGAWEGFRVEGVEYLEATREGTYLVLTHLSGRGRESSVPIEAETANVVTMRDGRIGRFELFWDRGEAYDAAGLPSH